MSLYKYYQVHGGEELWTPCTDTTDLEAIKPTFVTVLSCDTLLAKDSPGVLVDNAKYLGPLYFDLDSEDITDSIAGAKVLWAKLQGYGLLASDVEIYLSGKKGLHFLVQPIVFMEKIAPVNRLPAIYKELAFSLAVDTMDFAVYSARRGRMFRTHYNVRENGNYKVQITATELEDLTAESYQAICKNPRPLTPKTPAHRPAFSILYEGTRQKVQALKKARVKPVDAAMLRRHLPIVKRLMDGERIKESAGFNKIAIQLGIYAFAAKLSEDELIEQCQGLINGHHGDGYRYNSASKRENELRRMYNYLEDGVGYDYAIGPISAMLEQRNEFDEDDENSSEELTIEDNSGIFTKGNHYFAATEQGDRHIMDARFDDVETLLDPASDSIALIKATLFTGTKSYRVKLEREAFSGNGNLHKAISDKGAAFTGTDIHARYIYTHMLKETKVNGITSYATTSEGLDLVCMPHSAILEAREPFLIWADASVVRVPESLRDKGLRMELAPEQGQLPLLKTDLVNNPTWPEFVTANEDNADKFQSVLEGLIECQTPCSLANLIGWTTASFFTQLFRKVYSQFPLLHIAGPAGTGKTQMMMALMRMFYKEQAPQMFSAGSTIFSLHTAMGSSASIPVVLDEYKPHTMHPQKVEDLRSAFRSSYNGQAVARGGGNRMSSSFKALSYTYLLGPTVFMSEAAESESAILHRSVVVTLKRQPGRFAAKSAPAWGKLQAAPNLLGIFGAHLAASIIERYTPARLKEEFDPIHAAALKKWMPQPEDNLENTDAETLKLKNNMQERVLFNYAVAEFGLQVFKSTVELFFPGKVEHFADLLNPLITAQYTELHNVVSTSIPEYLKVLDEFSNMSRFPLDHGSRLGNKADFEIGSIGGKATLNIIAKLAYNKYRMHCRTINALPMYMNAESFAQSLKNCPVFITTGTGTKTISQETLVLDYEEMQRKGVYPFYAK